jgi:DNA-binding MarR family transcriptional regulator
LIVKYLMIFWLTIKSMTIIGGPMPNQSHAAPASLLDHTGYLLRLAFDRAQRVAAEEMPSGRHPRLFGVLTALVASGPVSQQQLADWLRVNRTQMVSLVDALEREGLVERRRDPADRRSYALHVTPAGRETLSALEAEVSHAERVMAEPLTAADHARLNDLLRTLIGRPVPPALADKTGFLISHAHLRARERANELFADLPIEIRHYGLMLALEQLGPSSQQALAREFHVSGTMVTQIVDDLERAGLAERRRNPADRRSYTVSLTDEGKRILAAAAQAVGTVNDELRAPIGEDGDRELRTLLRRLVEV